MIRKAVAVVWTSVFIAYFSYIRTGRFSVIELLLTAGICTLMAVPGGGAGFGKGFVPLRGMIKSQAFCMVSYQTKLF